MGKESSRDGPDQKKERPRLTSHPSATPNRPERIPQSAVLYDKANDAVAQFSAIGARSGQRGTGSRGQDTPPPPDWEPSITGSTLWDSGWIRADSIPWVRLTIKGRTDDGRRYTWTRDALMDLNTPPVHGREGERQDSEDESPDDLDQGPQDPGETDEFS